MRATLAVIALVCAGLVGCGAKAAPDDGTTSIYKACIDRSRGVTVEMHDCQAAEFELQDDRLNAAYKARMAALPADRQNALRLSERAWLKETTARCDRLGEDAGGSMAPLVVNDCWIAATIQRTRWLERYR